MFLGQLYPSHSHILLGLPFYSRCAYLRTTYHLITVKLMLLSVVFEWNFLFLFMWFETFVEEVLGQVTGKVPVVPDVVV